jgi:hypothetical protein
VPAAMILPSWIATASAVVAFRSSVRILPLNNTVVLL